MTLCRRWLLSRFAQLVQAQEKRKATEPESQLSTIADSQQATSEAIQIPPASQLSTTPPPPPPDHPPPPPPPGKKKNPKKRRVQPHKKKKGATQKGDRHRSDKIPFN